MASPLVLTTPLAPGTLLCTGVSATEPISRLPVFDLNLVAENGSPVPFDQLVGRGLKLAVTSQGTLTRYFHGICTRFSEGARGSTFTTYRAELVPQIWLLTLAHNSRIFQQKSVPDILRLVLGSTNVSYQLKGTYEKREYCVQYRESDFDFASRLMEEEGIYYYFRHTSSGASMVVGDTQTFPSVASPSTVGFATPPPPSSTDSSTVFAWEKFQELRSGKVTLWDHAFELPGAHLEGSAVTQDAVQLGTVTHHLALGNSGLERYDFPGGYAKRFDELDSGGAPSGGLGKIQPDATRTARIRMGQEALNALLVDGASNCRQFGGGMTFSLKNHFDGTGKYLITSVSHRYTVSGDPRTATQDRVGYHNDFTCIPVAVGLPFRPQRTTPVPTVHGSQTATVVGPAGSQVFTDKYGRVKVQFHWDREGKNDVSSSCWVRVGALHAGQEAGFVTVPRIGQEVVVAFLEGDPDQPIIVGSVYDPNHLPPPTPKADGGG
jgi:type VI secretion system secreted protein VgrG